MKISNYNFLASANIKKSKRSNSVFTLLFFSVISLLIITSYSVTLNHVMDNFTNQDPFRRLSINSPFNQKDLKVIDKQLLEKIEKIDHVQSVDMNDGITYQFFDIELISDEDNDCSKMLPIPLNECSVLAWSLYKTQHMNVVAGKSLDECPAFSCIVPSSFYPDNNYSAEKGGYNYQNGLDYLGKTLTIKASDDAFSVQTYQYIEDSGYMASWEDYPAIEYKLKIVGVFNAAYDGAGNPNEIYISNETGEKMLNAAVKATKNNNIIEQYEADKSKPELHSYTVLVDRAENVAAVRKELQDMNVSVFRLTERSVPDDVGLFASVFTAAGNFFTIAVLILTVINLFLSTSNNLLERKTEIGLLRALGYKNRQIFFSLYFEQLKLGLRAFFIGGGISAATVSLINLINANGPFINRIYVVNWGDFTLLACAALLLTAIMPLLCQLIFVGSMTKIQPRAAMAAQ